MTAVRIIKDKFYSSTELREWFSVYEEFSNLIYANQRFSDGYSPNYLGTILNRIKRIPPEVRGGEFNTKISHLELTIREAKKREKQMQKKMDEEMREEERKNSRK